MSEHTDDPAVPDWVRRMRADGYTVRLGTGTGGIPFEPEVAFTSPGDRDRVGDLEAPAVAEPAPPVTSRASTTTQMPDEADRPEEPYWVARLRAKGYTVRVGTDPTPLPVEPEDHFGPPYLSDHGRRWRLQNILRKLWNAGRLFKRRIAHP
jgi:hypothetical protein